jgi:hypothetical protein
VGSGVNFFPCAQRCNDDGHLVFHAQRHVVLKPVVTLVNDLVNGKGGGRLLGVGPVVRGKRLGNFNQPLFQLLGRSGIECRHRAHHTRNALGNHQLGVADDEQG